MDTKRSRRTNWDGVAATFGSIAALATALLLTPLRDTLGPTNVALILSLIIVGAAAAGGRLAGATTAVVGSLGFNAGYAPPYGTLRIDAPRDILTCVLMVVVGIAVGQLAHRARDLGHRATSGEVGLRHISELRELVAQHAEPDEIIERASGFLVEQLALRSCSFTWDASATPDPRQAPPELGPSGAIPGPLRHGHGGFQLPADGVSLPVTSSDGHILGRFVLEPTPGKGVALADRELAVLVADVVAPVLQSVPAPGDRPSISRTGTNR